MIFYKNNPRHTLMQIKRRGYEMRLVVGDDTMPPHIDLTLINATAHAHQRFQ